MFKFLKVVHTSNLLHWVFCRLSSIRFSEARFQIAFSQSTSKTSHLLNQTLISKLCSLLIRFTFLSTFLCKIKNQLFQIEIMFQVLQVHRVGLIVTFFLTKFKSTTLLFLKSITQFDLHIFHLTKQLFLYLNPFGQTFSPYQIPCLAFL